MLFDGVLMGSAPTGSVGEFEIRLPTPFQLKGERPLTVTVRDAATQVDKVTRVTNLAMRVSPRRASPGSASASAAAASRRPRRSSPTTSSAARSRGPSASPASRPRPCGTFSVKRRLIPVENARTGRWIMQVDQKREYSPEPDPVWVRRPIVVTPVVP